MKILLTCDPEIPVPPEKYGGVERLFDGLAKAYSSAGHEVYLLANPDSNSFFPKEIYSWPAVSSRGKLNVYRNTMKLRRVYHKIKPDVIHSFSRLLFTYPLLLTAKVPFLQTYGRFISPHSTRMASVVGRGKMNFTACGKHMLSHIANRPRWHVVYNFTPTDYFLPPISAKREYLVFLGRIEDIKGTYEAIQVAHKTGLKLIIAGNIANEHHDYFNQKIKPHIKEGVVEYIGTVDDEQKLPLLQGAKALLFPIKWEEPFGMVMIESMACSTPVIAFRRGAVEEVIKDGVTGFIVDNVDEMISAVGRLDEIDRIKVRNDVVERFSTPVIAQQYMKILSEITHKK